MAQVVLGYPTVTFASPGIPAAEVVGTDPWGDTDDGTYARGYVQAGTTSGFHHIEATITPTTIDPATLTVSLRMSATASVAFPATLIGRAVMNLYGPTGSSPPLNLQAGSNPVYVVVPTVDGTIYDIAATIYDWNTETPATPEQVASYFAAGGRIRVQPSMTGGGAGTMALTIHRLAFEWAGDVELPVAYRRVWPQRDDALAGGARRTWPPSRTEQSGNRTFGGYF